jgi:hypothetical protein
VKRNYRVFAAEIRDLSSIEQRIVQTVTLTKWLRTQLHRNFNLIITRRLDRVASEFQAATGQRLYVRQIARGVYRQLTDEGGQATTLGIAVAAALTVLAVNLITSMVFFFTDIADPVTRSHDMILFSSLAIVVFLVYGTIWLRIGAQTVYRLRQRTA